MDNKPLTLWDQNMDTPQKLRMPNTPSNLLLKTDNKSESSQQNKSNNVTDTQANDHNNIPNQKNLSTNEKVFHSSLRVEAPEFVPSYNNFSVFHNNERDLNATPSSTIGNSVQDRLRRPKLVDSGHVSVTPMDLPVDDFIDSSDDIRLRHLIDTLTKDPGQFGDLYEIFMDTITPYFDNITIISRAVELLVYQAISYPSFRYSAARLCCIIESCCPEFRAGLYLKCKTELEKNLNKSGLLLFVAELYMQLHHENIYGTYLIEAFKHLLGIGGNENIKSICQALKLTGHSLELYNKKALDEVFIKLQEVKPSATGTSLSLINSVINLRSSQWGHNSPNNTNITSEPENQYWGDIQRTVFYNADGSQFSNEESEFLAGNINSAEEYFTDTSDPDELCDPEPEMDEEIQAAFKDFVKLSKR